MLMQEDEFMQKLLFEFKEESATHLQIISAGLLEIEKKTTSDKDKLAILENIYRESHTLKGTARVLNLEEIEKICQGMENIFSIWKISTAHISQTHIDLLYSAMDMIEHMTMAVVNKKPSIDAKQLNHLLTQLNNVTISNEKTTTFKKERSFTNNLSFKNSNVSISTKKLDKLFLQSEEMGIIKLMLDQRTSDAYKLENSLHTLQRDLDNLSFNFIKSDNPAAFSVENFYGKIHVLLKQVEKEISIFTHKMDLDRHSIHRLIDLLINETKKTFLLPFSTLLKIFPKMVRDLSHDEGKKVILEIDGDDIEIDKRILEEIKDSLIHIIRNSIDHGIENPSERQQNNKPSESILKMHIHHHIGNEIEITIADDGRGIDKEALINSAIKHGMISKDSSKALSDADVYDLIYQSGISTSPALTNISGHGLGMAIVKEKIEKIGGKITIHSIPLQGTTITIILPLTIATYKGVLLEVSSQIFALPTAHLERVLRIPLQQIKYIENNETISVDNKILRLLKLADILEIPSENDKEKNNEFIQAVIIRAKGMRIALKVDEVLQEQEIIVKNFMKPLKRIRNISGATLLGSGKTIPILNVEDIIQSALKNTFHAVKMEEHSNKSARSILLVEDSITTRVLLKSILELAGFKVITAVNGTDALLLLKSYQISLIISDIEMPQMDGLALTKKIRRNNKLANLPIILLTSHESSKDCEQGLQAGANAYILKSNFDSTNILKVIHRLIH